MHYWGSVYCVGDQYSMSSTVYFSIPQGGVLGPILFLLYMADVLTIAARHNVGIHSYADDTQLYLHTTIDNCTATFTRLLCCINEVGLWMSSNRLKLNIEETQFTCCGTQYQLAKVNATSFVVNGSAVTLLTSYSHLPWHHRGSCCLLITLDTLPVFVFTG